jgi:hypothetical protein
MISCPKGHIGLLDHAIDEHGVVTPSVVCMTQGCDFHQEVVLEGWGDA